MRVAVFGDTGGQYNALRQGLDELGVGDETIPEDLIVVHVGDLIHKGPATSKVVALVDRMLETDQWIQLIGNHEAQYLGGPRFWDENIVPDAITTIQEWWIRGLVGAAAVVGSSDGEYLITHAGLSRLWWQHGCKSDLSAVACAQQIDTWNMDQISHPGLMLGSSNGGILWANAGVELYGSWSGSYIPPFHQIHGHNAVYNWNRNDWYKGMETLRYSARNNLTRRYTITKIGGKKFIAVDPGYGRREVTRRQFAYLLDGEILFRKATCPDVCLCFY